MAATERSGPKRSDLFQMLVPVVAGRDDVDVCDLALIRLDLSYSLFRKPFLKDLQLFFERSLNRFVSRIYSTVVGLLPPVMKYSILLYLKQVRGIRTLEPKSRQRGRHKRLDLNRLHLSRDSKGLEDGLDRCLLSDARVFGADAFPEKSNMRTLQSVEGRKLNRKYHLVKRRIYEVREVAHAIRLARDRLG